MELLVGISVIFSNFCFLEYLTYYMVTEKSADTHSLIKVRKSRPMCKGRHGGEGERSKGHGNRRFGKPANNPEEPQDNQMLLCPEIRKKVVEKVETATTPRTMNSG